MIVTTSLIFGPWMNLKKTYVWNCYCRQNHHGTICTTISQLRGLVWVYNFYTIYVYRHIVTYAFSSVRLARGADRISEKKSERISDYVALPLEAISELSIICFYKRQPVQRRKKYRIVIKSRQDCSWICRDHALSSAFFLSIRQNYPSNNTRLRLSSGGDACNPPVTLDAFSTPARIEDIHKHRSANLVLETSFFRPSLIGSRITSG